MNNGERKRGCPALPNKGDTDGDTHRRAFGGEGECIPAAGAAVIDGDMPGMTGSWGRIVDCPRLKKLIPWDLPAPWMKLV